MAGAAHQILITGLGDIAQVHLRVLEQVPGADVIAGVDIAARPGVTFRGHPIPVYPTLADAARDHDPAIVVIATPTPTHADVCDQAAAAFPAARLLVEKPAADTLARARHVIEDIGARQPVDIAYHMAFSPQVGWGAGITRDRAAQLGNPVAITCYYADPYSRDADLARARFGTSWLDSGINALSVLRRFTALTGRAFLRGLGDPAWSAWQAGLTCRNPSGAEFGALIVTNWHVSGPAKTTTVTYESGAQLVLDHTAVSGYLITGHQVTDLYGFDASTPRRVRHYQALYQSWLTEGRPIATTGEHLLLHDLLLAPPDDIPG
jgi:predicted dehydrogenase